MIIKLRQIKVYNCMIKKIFVLEFLIMYTTLYIIYNVTVHKEATILLLVCT